MIVEIKKIIASKKNIFSYSHEFFVGKKGE